MNDTQNHFLYVHIPRAAVHSDLMLILMNNNHIYNIFCLHSLLCLAHTHISNPLLNMFYII